MLQYASLFIYVFDVLGSRKCHDLSSIISKRDSASIDAEYAKFLQKVKRNILC